MARSKQASSGEKAQDAIALLKADHRQVEEWFGQFEKARDADRKQKLATNICQALKVHATIEEEIFYPAMNSVGCDRETLGKSPEEHDEMRELIATLRSMQPNDSLYDQTVMQLMRTVMHHVADEETILLPDAEVYLSDRLGELGLEMTKRRLQLSAPKMGEIAVNTLRGMPATSMVLAAGAVLAGKIGRAHV